MAGGLMMPGGKGGRKPLDAALNLVPFIDLLSCCISFLLITAVWTQLARMDVSQKGQGAAGAESEKPPEPTVQLTLFIDKDGYTFTKSGGDSSSTSIPKRGEEYDYVKLADTLKDAKTAYPDKNDIQVKSDDDVLYNNIIRTMDVVLSNKFPDVSLADKGAGS